MFGYSIPTTGVTSQGTSCKSRPTSQFSRGSTFGFAGFVLPSLHQPKGLHASAVHRSLAAPQHRIPAEPKGRGPEHVVSYPRRCRNAGNPVPVYPEVSLSPGSTLILSLLPPAVAVPPPFSLTPTSPRFRRNTCPNPLRGGCFGSWGRGR